jgi:benzoate membrane transport protein
LADRSFWRDLSLPAVVAGFVAVLVGYTSSVVIIFQAAAALGATPAQTASWLWALGLGMGLTSAGLSLWYRMPVLTAWSTPGAALLVTAGAGVPMAEGMGAFVVCAVLITLAGASGLFARVMDRIPQALAAALLAGVLTRFAFDAFLAVRTQTLLVLLMGAACWPAPLVAALRGAGRAGWWAPRWPLRTGNCTWGGGLATSPRRCSRCRASACGAGRRGAAAVRGDHGVAEPARRGGAACRGLRRAGVAADHHHRPGTLLLAPFGAYALNLAAITAAICMGREATKTRRGATPRR